MEMVGFPRALRLCMYVGRPDQLKKPFDSRNRKISKVNSLEKDVVYALFQGLNGLPFIIETHKNLPSVKGTQENIDVVIRDRDRRKTYALIECKNIHSKNSHTIEQELQNAAAQLRPFAEKNILKFCIVPNDVLSYLSENAIKKITHEYKLGIHSELYNWSDDHNWLKMIVKIRNKILSYYGWKEDGEFYDKIHSFAEDELNLSGRGIKQFNKAIGLSRGADRWGRSHSDLRRYNQNR
jgi:hypothetical protein